MSNPETCLPPGFRFHPTDEELILHYLKKKVGSSPCPVSIIAEVDIYKFDPWDLPAIAAFGEKEWYFFSPRDRKYPNGARPNRAAVSGYWKATGTDKLIMTKGRNDNIGVKKALVFYEGRPPKGLKTAWIMHEYRLSESTSNIRNKPIKSKDTSMRLDEWVLCRIYRKGLPLSTYSQQQEDPLIQEIPNQTNLPIQKSSSFSDLLSSADFSLLSRFLLDNQSDSTPSQLTHIFNNSNLYQPNNNSSITTNNNHNNNNSSSSTTTTTTNNNSSYSLQQVTMDNQFNPQPPAPVTTTMTGEGVLSHPCKKFNNACTFTNMINHLDTSQYHPLFNHQQILLNSHLQFQSM